MALCLFLFVLPSPPPQEGPHPTSPTHSSWINLKLGLGGGKDWLDNREALQIRLGLSGGLQTCTPHTGEAEAGECRV